MSITINVNGRSLVHKASDGFARATLPDVCYTPMPGGPVPIAYQNLAFSSDLADGTCTVFADGGNSAAIKGSCFAVSTGDEPGTCGGIISGTFTKEATWLSFSFDVRLEGSNACRLSDKMLMNHGNTACLSGEIQVLLKALMTLGEIYMLCEVFCYCMYTGGNQACVEEKLKEVDAAMGGTSPLQPEIPYNMTTSPPKPMMSTTNPRTGSGNWRFPNHPEHPDDFVPGEGMVRRPDVVISDNPFLPPGGSNLRAVVEMKFPNDPNPFESAEMMARERDYWRIANENNPSAIYARIDKYICGCDAEGHPAPAREPVKVPQRVWKPVTQQPPVTTLPPVTVTAPSGFWGGLAEAGLGLAEMVGGTLLFGVSAVATGVLVVDDASGVLILDDVLIPVGVAGMGVGGVGVLDGQRHWSSGIRRMFGW